MTTTRRAIKDDIRGIGTSLSESLYYHKHPFNYTITRVQTKAPAGDHHWSNRRSCQPLLNESPEELDSTVSTPKEGLYYRTKRALGLKRDFSDPVEGAPRSRTPKGNVLDRVSSTLQDVAMKRIMASSAKTSVSDLSIAAPHRHRVRPATEYSTTSSIREMMMMEKPPIFTPDPEEMYSGADSQKYVTAKLSEPDNPSFLPSEACRIQIPPLPDNSPVKGKHRGFFFDYSSPTTQEERRTWTGIGESWMPSIQCPISGRNSLRGSQFIFPPVLCDLGIQNINQEVRVIVSIMARTRYQPWGSKLQPQRKMRALCFIIGGKHSRKDGVILLSFNPFANCNGS